MTDFIETRDGYLALGKVKEFRFVAGVGRECAITNEDEVHPLWNAQNGAEELFAGYIDNPPGEWEVITVDEDGGIGPFKVWPVLAWGKLVSGEIIPIPVGYHHDPVYLVLRSKVHWALRRAGFRKVYAVDGYTEGQHEDAHAWVHHLKEKIAKEEAA